MIVGYLNFRFKPKFGLPISIMNMDMHSIFFTRKEEKAVTSDLEDSWTHGFSLTCLFEIVFIKLNIKGCAKAIHVLGPDRV